ncbi:transcriptional regulator family: Fungal Specific TF [Penicillium brevicompactum]|uniref:transcriptional regulator family: Fungal Specific TF n=1 Tax=Penicillium brevicompactum TaxID=5074 RepID=UPI0025420B3A|nr:transcriptional regulator family: Fungal Specific TF [Penicillium brevicompactum]KAJ5336786.1 transcriptional regulator family: Fungal Specific TF [Penicillium brevicompactum]
MGQLRPKRKASATTETTMPEHGNANAIANCEPSKCVYPESGKRGLPLGYLNQLEQRLAETESALYGALMTLRSIGQTTTPVSKPEVSKQKAARMEEWSQLPIREWSDLEHWMTVMSDQFSAQSRATSETYAIPGTLETREPQSAPYSWQGDGRIDARIGGILMRRMIR